MFTAGLDLSHKMSTGASAVLQALQYLDRDAQGQLHEHHKRWKEYWCVKNQRLYYVNNAAGAQLCYGMSASSPLPWSAQSGSA